MDKESKLKHAQSLLDEAYGIVMNITEDDHLILHKIDDVQNELTILYKLYLGEEVLYEFYG